MHDLVTEIADLRYGLMRLYGRAQLDSLASKRW
jgi:hypothetical protein